MTIKAKARLKDLAVQLSSDPAAPAPEAPPPIPPENREVEPADSLPSESSSEASATPAETPVSQSSVADQSATPDPPPEMPIPNRPRKGIEATLLGIVFSIVFIVFAVFILILLNEPIGLPLKSPAWRHGPSTDEPINTAKPVSADNTGQLRPATAADKEKVPGTAYTNSIGMSFVRIPKGCFMMGVNDPGTGEGGTMNALAAHQVCIGRDFLLSRTEVTQAQWMAVMETNPSKFQESQRPVEEVSWMDAQAFVQRLNRREGGDHYRLPTEAEWEYAARAGTSHRYVFADTTNEADQYAWFADNADGQTHPVGQKRPNPWGLHDMQGNVYEWIQDWYEADYALDSPRMDPSGPPAGDKRVIRGGGWPVAAAALDSASRHGVPPDTRGGALGFRVVRRP